MTQCDTTMVLEVKKPLQSGEWHSDKQIPTVGSGGVETESVIEAKPKAFKALNTSLSHKRVQKQFNLFFIFALLELDNNLSSLSTKLKHKS